MINEGERFTLSNARWQVDVTGTGWEHRYREDGVYTLIFTTRGGTTHRDCTFWICDTDHHFNQESTSRTMVVHNVAPAMTNILVPATVVILQGFNLSARATDPGLDRLTYQWDLDGDGEFDDRCGDRFPGQTYGSFHVYRSLGTRTVRVRGWDGKAFSGTPSAVVEVAPPDSDGDGVRDPSDNCPLSGEAACLPCGDTGQRSAPIS